MASAANAMIERIIRRYVHPVLKDHGFVRKGRIWNRLGTGDVGQTVDIQTSQWNHGSDGSFTINVGVFIPYIYSIYLAPATSTLIGPTPSTISLRIGALRDGGSLLGEREGYDIWWDVGTDIDPDEVGRTVRDILLTRALPFLDKFTAPQDVVTFIRAHPNLNIQVWQECMHSAILLHNLGEPDRAQSILEQVAREHPYWKNIATTTMERLRMQQSTVD